MSIAPDLKHIKTLYCSFCKKSQHDVSHLIASPPAFICNECISLSVQIILDPKRVPARTETAA